MLLFYLNAGFVLLLLVVTAAALVALAFTRPPEEVRLPTRRRAAPRRPGRPSGLRGATSHRRRAA